MLRSFIAIALVASVFAGPQPNRTDVAPTFTVDLDLAPADRWTDIVALYKSSAPLILDYVTAALPAPVVKVLEYIMGNLDELLGDYGAEMRGVAQAYGLELGVIVALNFAYELRKWGGGHPNVTYYPHVCTSIVSQDTTGAIFHGRNMDWNLPENIRNLSVQVEFQRGGKTQYVGATYVGFVGIFTGMRPESFSVSVNERDIGGSPIIDALNAIVDGAFSVTHLLRSTLERAGSYAEAMHILSSSPISAPVFYIAAGLKPAEGVVLTRSREFTRDAWHLGSATPAWYLLQTNYDHWLPDPVHDARRTYGDAHMTDLGQSGGASLVGEYTVLSTWPVMNNFTCQSVMMQPSSGYFRTYIRYFF